MVTATIRFPPPTTTYDVKEATTCLLRCFTKAASSSKTKKNENHRGCPKKKVVSFDLNNKSSSPSSPKNNSHKDPPIVMTAKDILLGENPKHHSFEAFVSNHYDGYVKKYSRHDGSSNSYCHQVIEAVQQAGGRFLEQRNRGTLKLVEPKRALSIVRAQFSHKRKAEETDATTKSKVSPQPTKRQKRLEAPTSRPQRQQASVPNDWIFGDNDQHLHDFVADHLQGYMASSSKTEFCRVLVKAAKNDGCRFWSSNKKKSGCSKVRVGADRALSLLVSAFSYKIYQLQKKKQTTTGSKAQQAAKKKKKKTGTVSALAQKKTIKTYPKRSSSVKKKHVVACGKGVKPDPMYIQLIESKMSDYEAADIKALVLKDFMEKTLPSGWVFENQEKTPHQILSKDQLYKKLKNDFHKRSS